MESPAGSKENHEPHMPGTDLTKAMNSAAAAAVRAEPVPDSACLTPRNGKRKLPPPAPLLAALFGPDYQTMSPDPRLPPFNERIAGMQAATSNAMAAGGGGSGPSGLSLFNAVRRGGPPVSRLPEALRQKLPEPLRRPHASAGVATAADMAPGADAIAPEAGSAAGAGEGVALPLAGGAPVQEQARARPTSVAALGDVQAAILYAEAERVMEFLQERRNLARLASEFDDRLRSLCDVFCSTAAAAKPTPQAGAPVASVAAAATGTATHTEQETMDGVKAEPADPSGNPSNAPDGAGGEQPAKRRRRPPAKHEGFCTSDGAALVAEGLESGPTEKSTKAGGAAEGKDKPQGEQSAMYKGIKLDGAAAADHTAALYCAINETLEKLSSRKMYKSGATALRSSVDRALLMCSQLEAGTGAESTMVLESVLNNPLPLAKFPWSRRHEALRLARLALHSLHHLFAAGLGDFNLEVTFSPSCAFSPTPACAAPSTSGAAETAAPAGAAQEIAVGSPPRARRPAAPHTLTVASPGKAAVPAAAVAAAGRALAMQEKLDIGIQTDSGSARSGGECEGAAEEQGTAPMDTDAPHSSTPPAMAPPGPAANVLQAMSRSASCAMEGDAVLRKGEAALAGAPRTDTTAVAAPPSDVAGTPKQHESDPATDAAAAGVLKAADAAPSLLHTLANAATADADADGGKASGASQPLGAFPPSMAPSIVAGQDAASAPQMSAAQMNVAELFTQWPMPLGQAASMPDASAASKSQPEASLSQVLHAIPEGALAPGDAPTAVAGVPSGAFSPAAFSGFAGFGGLLPGNAMPLDPAGGGAFPKVDPLARPGGPNLTAAAAVTTDELMNAFDEASELRLRALGAVGGALAAGRGGKRRRVDGGRTFHQSIGIGNVGKKGGSDTPGGVQVSMVALCNYILTHGGWEKMKSDREAKLELLKHFGWDHGLPAGKSAVFKEDKAIQSLTTQVREYFVKTGVFHVLSTNRVSADGTATTSGAVDASPSDAPFAAQQPSRSAPELLGSPALQGFQATASTGGAPHHSASGASPGAAYSVPMHHGAYTDPTDQLPRSLAFSLANQGVLPVSCNTDPLPHRSPDAPNRMSSHGTVGPSMLSAAPPQLPTALPMPPQSAAAPGALGVESVQDRAGALHMRALMEAVHMMQTHGPDSVAAQHACMIAQATGRLGPQGMPSSGGMAAGAAGMGPSDMDLMRQLATQMHLPNASSQLAPGVPAGMHPLGMNPQFQAAMQVMWAPPDSSAGAFPAASAAPAASSPAKLAAGAPVSPAAASAAVAGGAVGTSPSAFAASVGGQVSAAPSGGGTVSGGAAAGGSSPARQGGARNDVSATSAGGSPAN